MHDPVSTYVFVILQWILMIELHMHICAYVYCCKMEHSSYKSVMDICMLRDGG